MNTVNKEQIHLIIDGQAISVPKGTTVYAAARQLGIDIPIFCYQDRMPPFGACRVCLVEIEKMPKLQTSCTLEVAEGMVVKTQAQAAVKGREEILEFLLINHPLDCPICDRGGECPLQDQALKFGPGKSRFYEEKRHFKKPLPLGPVLMLDRERCIACARCTRFGDLIAGDHALEFIERGYKTEVGTPSGGPAESKFIGNTIMICPVGALTSQAYRFRARPWDNQSTKTVCTLCPVGCSMILDARDGEIMRTRSCENREINDIWLCDKGWFGYEFADHPDRLKFPLIRRLGKLEPASWEEALSLIATQLTLAKPSGKIGALGGTTLTVEENYLLQKLIKEWAEVEHVDYRVGMPIIDLNQEILPPGMELAIGDCEQLSYALLLGVDLTEEFPLIWLRLKQAINHGAEVIFIGHYAPEVAFHLKKTQLHAPGQEVEILRQYQSEMQRLTSDSTKKGAIFLGRQYLASRNRQNILSLLMQWQNSMPHVTINLLEGRGNSQGARFAGMHPELRPFDQPSKEKGLNTVQLLNTCVDDGWQFLYVAGANPAERLPSKLWQTAHDRLNFLVVQDLFLTSTAQDADVVLPTLCFAEKEGHFINIDGHIQKLHPGKGIPSGIYSDADIFKKVAALLNFPLNVDNHLLEILHLKKIPYKRNPIPQTKAPKNDSPSTLTATFAHPLFDAGVRMQKNKQLSQLIKSPKVRLHPQEGKRRDIQDGDKVRITANHHSIIAMIQWDSRVAEGVLVLPLGFQSLPVQELEVYLLNGFEVNLTKEISHHG